MTVGVDLGQSQDPTAVVVVRSYRMAEPDHPFGPGAPLPLAARGRRPRRETHHQITHISRIPLRTSYPEVIERVKGVADWASEYGRTQIVLDATGVGRPVVDMFRRDAPGYSVRGITFTSGATVSKATAFDWRVPKRDLVGAVLAVDESGRLKALPNLNLAADLREELRGFTYSMTDVGHDTFEASAGHHDDLVCALALAVWWAENSTTGQGTAFLEAWRQMGRRG